MKGVECLSSKNSLFKSSQDGSDFFGGSVKDNVKEQIKAVSRGVGTLKNSEGGHDG